MENEGEQNNEIPSTLSIRRERQVAEKEKKTNEKVALPETKLNNNTVWLMVSTSLFFDLANGLVNLIPIAGQIISMIITGIALGLFFFWFILKGVRLTTPKRLATMGGGFLVDFIPIVNVLPGITGAVVGTILTTKIKEVEKKKNIKKSVLKFKRQEEQNEQKEYKKAA